MKRKAEVAITMPDPIRQAAGLPIGDEAAYFVGGKGDFGQDHDNSIVDYNEPPTGQPGLWCQWIIEDNEIIWDGGEKFYNYIEWIEYLIENTQRKIPIRMGAFYDPEPAGGQPDDFYGISFGTGIIYNELFSLDFAYQFRLGKKKNAEVIEGQNISSKVTQHYFYTSIICYLF